MVNVLVTTELRVGSTWLCRLLKDILNMSLKWTFIEKGQYGSIFRILKRVPKQGNHLLKVHHVPPKDVVGKIDKVITITRDVKDTIISRAFYENSRRRGRKLDPTTCGKQIVDRFLKPDIIKNVIDEWKKFNNDYSNPSFLLIHYEDLKKDIISELRKICVFLGLNRNNIQLRKIAQNNSFQSITGRSPGNENGNAHNRKGIVGDWKNYLDDKTVNFIQSLLLTE